MLSAFTFYIIAVIVAAVVALYAGRALSRSLVPLFGTAHAPGILATGVVRQIVFFLGVLIAGAFAAEVSFLFGLPVLTLGSDYFGIATLGFAIVVQTLMVNSDTILPFTEMKGGRGMIGIPKMTSWVAAFLFLFLVIVLVRNFVRSSTGRAIMSVREDETAAKAMGIDVAGSKLLAFVVGSFVAGIGGGVYAHYIGFLSPNTFSFIAGFNPLIIVVFGGLGSMTGTLAASFVWIFFLEGFLRVLLGQMGTEAPTWRFVLYPITLLLLMLIRPQGLLGSREWGFLKPERIVRRLKGGGPGTAARKGAGLTWRTRTQTGPLLDIHEITKFFGGLCAVKSFSLAVPEGALWGLIGPNGAGQDHRLQSHHRSHHALLGRRSALGEDRIDGLESFEITRLGIARTFQNIRLFSNLSVLDNVRIAYHPHAGYGLSDSLLRTPQATPGTKRSSPSRRWSSFRSSSWKGSRRRWRRTCPTGSSAGWRLRGRWPASRACCSWMSPRRA